MAQGQGYSLKRSILDSSLALTISHYTVIKTMFMYFCVWFSWVLSILDVLKKNESFFSFPDHASLLYRKNSQNWIAIVKEAYGRILKVNLSWSPTLSVNFCILQLVSKKHSSVSHTLYYFIN